MKTEPAHLEILKELLRLIQDDESKDTYEVGEQEIDYCEVRQRTKLAILKAIEKEIE